MELDSTCLSLVAWLESFESGFKADV